MNEINTVKFHVLAGDVPSLGGGVALIFVGIFKVQNRTVTPGSFLSIMELKKPQRAGAGIIARARKVGLKQKVQEAWIIWASTEKVYVFGMNGASRLTQSGDTHRVMSAR